MHTEYVRCNDITAEGGMASYNASGLVLVQMQQSVLCALAYMHMFALSQIITNTYLFMFYLL